MIAIFYQQASLKVKKKKLFGGLDQKEKRFFLEYTAMKKRKTTCLLSSPGRGHCVVFLGKTLNSHSASLHPGV